MPAKTGTKIPLQVLRIDKDEIRIEDVSQSEEKSLQIIVLSKDFKNHVPRTGYKYKAIRKNADDRRNTVQTNLEEEREIHNRKS